MSYVPNNAKLFFAVYSSALAAMNMSSRPFEPSAVRSYYDDLAVVAGAFAQAVDTRITAAPNDMSLTLLQEATAAIWQKTAPPNRLPASTSPATYAQIASALATMVQSASSYLSSEDITPSAVVASPAYSLTNYINPAFQEMPYQAHSNEFVICQYQIGEEVPADVVLPSSPKAGDVVTVAFGSNDGPIATVTASAIIHGPVTLSFPPPLTANPGSCSRTYVYAGFGRWFCIASVN